jgi:hypothetical protein
MTPTSITLKKELLRAPESLDLELSDEYIYSLLLKEAEEAKQRANKVGVLGYLSKYK